MARLLVGTERDLLWFLGFFEQSASVRHSIPKKTSIVMSLNRLCATIVVPMMTYNGEGALLGGQENFIRRKMTLESERGYDALFS